MTLDQLDKFLEANGGTLTPPKAPSFYAVITFANDKVRDQAMRNLVHDHRSSATWVMGNHYLVLDQDEDHLFILKLGPQHCTLTMHGQDDWDAVESAMQSWREHAVEENLEFVQNVMRTYQVNADICRQGLYHFFGRTSRTS